MTCCINFFKSYFDKLKNNVKNDDKNDAIRDYDNECCICFDYINERPLACGHNVHIICIFKSKKICCPLCRANIINDCFFHIKTCKDKKCICKTPHDELENIIAHDIINTYISSCKKFDMHELRKKLKKNNINNIDKILQKYI